jgi:signal transduction histidine kinase
MIDRPARERFALSIVAVAAAFLLRLSLDGVLHQKLPFAAFLVATTLMAWYAGFGPSILTFVSGMFLANWFFMAPHHFAWNSADNVGPNVSTLIVGITIILFGRSMHHARRRANAHAQEAIAHQKRLEEVVQQRIQAEEKVRQLNTELEKRVEQRTAELTASNEELESFTYSVSHDLRAPLRHVDGYAQMLEEEYATSIPEDARKFVKKIRQGSENMRQLVDDLLNLSHLGKAELTRHPADLKPLVEEVVRDLKLETAGRSIEWEIGELPEVDCDSGLMRQVFTNLLANSAKYTRRRQDAHIEVGQTRVNGETAIFVKDNGVGFNMKYVNKLFGVFQRLHRSEEFEGTGVGLATVARIIRKHGGRVWAEGEINHGATFYFTLENLPQAAAPAANGAAKPAGAVETREPAGAKPA